jgi:hypothetical protein
VFFFSSFRPLTSLYTFRQNVLCIQPPWPTINNIHKYAGLLNSRVYVIEKYGFLCVLPISQRQNSYMFGYNNDIITKQIDGYKNKAHDDSICFMYTFFFYFILFCCSFNSPRYISTHNDFGGVWVRENHHHLKIIHYYTFLLSKHMFMLWGIIVGKNVYNIYVRYKLNIENWNR